jgi:thiol-disulfide isomerase/thioredoxin
MIRFVLAAALAALCLPHGRAADEPKLGVGDASPKLEVKEFVKGEPVKGLAKGQIYVVEFWATWCGPCRATIPHLTKLQKQYKDKVVFIGVSVWERDQGKVKPFVDEMGEKMDYRVALDEVGKGKGNDGKMATNWMTAAGQQGIPTAFVVNGDGKIAWIGHPAEMDKPLEQIVAGKWDLAKAADDFKKAASRQAKLEKLFDQIDQADEKKDHKAVVKLIDEAVKEDPELEEQLGMVKFGALIKLGDVAKTVEYGSKLADKGKDNEQQLNALAWFLVESPGPKPDPKLMKFALEVAQKADKLAGGKAPDVADTLAKAYYENGDFAKALENQERAVKLAKGTPFEKDEDLKERLELYRKKAAEKK